MAFIAPFFAAVAGSVFGGAVLQIGAGLALGFVANALKPKPKATSGAARGQRVGLQIAADVPRQVLFGETATAGSLVYWQLSGSNNSRLHMVIALADHECDGLNGVWVNGHLKTIDGAGAVADYQGKLTVSFYAGGASQTADADLIATSGGRWTANERGLNVCYVVVRIDYDEKLLPDIPDFAFIVRGAKLTDPRTGLTSYTANPAVILYNVLRGVAPGGLSLLGMNVPDAAIRSDDVIAAANACDEAIPLSAGGSEQRYTTGLVVEATETNRTVIERLLAAMGGQLIETGGVYRIMAGVAQTVVMTLDDADLIVDKPFSASPKRPRSELTNAVGGRYAAPANGYQLTPLPVRASSADETADGGLRLAQSLDLDAVTSRTQGQRLMEIARRRGRRQLNVSGTFRSRVAVLEPGDWITLTSARRGYVARTFEVAGLSIAQDMTCELKLTETDAAIDDWAPTDEIADNSATDLLSAGPTLATVSGLVLETVVVESLSGAQRPGLRITWTAIDDPTIIELALEYRRVGDTVALEGRILDPSAAQYTWLNGVIGDTDYQARLKPITRPERTTTWSSWAQTVGVTDPQIVEVAALATSVPPDTITAEMLDPQARFELSLTTAVQDALGQTLPGTIDAALVAARDQAWAAAEATIHAQLGGAANAAAISVEQITRQTETLSLAQQITTVNAGLSDTNALVVAETVARADGDSALAADITTVNAGLSDTNALVAAETVARADGDSALAADIATLTSTVNGNTAAISSEVLTRADADSALAADITTLDATVGDQTATLTTYGAAIDGIHAQWGVEANIDGQVVGAVRLDGTPGTSTFEVLTDKFTVAAPDGSGGRAVFQIGTVTGVGTVVALAGDMIVDGAISAQHLNVGTLSAISADLGTVTAGLIRSADGLSFWDLNNNIFQIGTT